MLESIAFDDKGDMEKKGGSHHIKGTKKVHCYIMHFCLTGIEAYVAKGLGVTNDG